MRHIPWDVVKGVMNPPTTVKFNWACAMMYDDNYDVTNSDSLSFDHWT